jgi:hypothetical protein
MISSISQGRRWASALAVSTLATTLALPTIAIAAPPEDSSAGGVSDCIVAEQGGPQTAGDAGTEEARGAVDCEDGETTTEETEPPELGEDQGRDESRGQGPVGLIEEICETPLASFTPGGHHGVSEAIAITSQSFDGNATAWEHLGWEAAPGATISAVAVVHPAGPPTVTKTNDRSGVAEDVLQLIFCGEFAPDTTPGGGENGNDTGVTSQGVEIVSGSDDTTTPIAGVSESPETTVTDEDEAEVRGAVRRPAPDRIAPAPRTDQVVAATTDGGEVLGVTLARTGTDLGGLAAAGTLGLLAGGLVLLSTRRRETEEVVS